MIIVDRINNLDTLEIQLEMNTAAFADSVRELEALAKRLRASVESTLGIAAKITFVEPHTLPRVEGKANRVIDKRALK